MLRLRVEGAILKRLENPKLSRLFFRLTAFRPAYNARITVQNAPCQAPKYSPIILPVFQLFDYTHENC